MICDRRLYKGEDIQVLVPFSVSGYSSLSIEFYTDGEYKYIIDNPQVVDGEIVAEMSEHDLDLLGDGVLRYNVSYDIDGERIMFGTNTNYVLKTPSAYSAMTPTDYYLSGYTAGQEECSGGSQVEIGYAVITMQNEQYTETYEAGHYPYATGDAWSSVTIDNLPYRNYWYQSGYTQGQADCDCTEAFQSGYTSASDYYKKYRRNYAFSGTITFNRDFTYGEEYHYSDDPNDYSQGLFGTFIHGTTYSGTPLTKFNEAYQEAGGIYVHRGAFWSAGTYPYSSEFEQEFMYESWGGAIKDGYVETPAFFNPKDGHIDVKLYFTGDNLD